MRSVHLRPRADPGIIVAVRKRGTRPQSTRILMQPQSKEGRLPIELSENY